MSPREWQLRIEDMLEALARIERYTARLDAAGFAADELVIDAVVRNFTVLGEAARHIPPGIEARYPDIPWVRMRGLRNVVVHAYFGVDVDVLWETTQHDLPPLVPALRALLKQDGQPGTTT